jgi:hypothetical protein
MEMRMKVSLGKVVRERDRREVDHAIAEALRRLRLALGEVRVVERKQGGVVTSRRVVNKEALTRAERAYHTAATLVGRARQADGTATGPQRADRAPVRQACETLSGYSRKLDELMAAAE